jgi:nucleosome assembly protein 1-like 1
MVPWNMLDTKGAKKEPHKGLKTTKPITTKDCVSFFNFFSPLKFPNDEKKIDDDIVSF